MVDTDTSSRLPDSIGATTAGSVTVTVAAPDSGTGTRIGATALPRRVRVPSAVTSYVLPNRTASAPAGWPGTRATVSVTRGAPASSVGCANGAVRNWADWPGSSAVSAATRPATAPRAPPSPGIDVSAAGFPPAGFSTACGAPSRRLLVLGDGGGAGDAGVGVGEHGAPGRGGGPGTDPALHGVAERALLAVRRGAGQVLVEPVADAGAGGGVGWPAVVAARVPDHRDGRAVRGDLAGVGVGLVQPEQGVGLALDEQRRRGDAVGHRGGGGAQQERGQRGRRAPGGGGLGVAGADVGAEPAAGGRSRRRRTAALRRAQPGGEEHPGPAALEHTVRGEGAARRGVDRRRRRGGSVGEQGLTQVVPGDHRGDRVDPAVVAGEQQRQRAAVGRTGDADPRIAGPVQQHLGAGGQPVEQALRVGDLVVGRVEPDLPAARTEPAGRPRQHDEPAIDELARVGVDGGLAAAEPVREEDSRGRGRRGQVEGGVELDGSRDARTAGDGDPLLGGAGRWRDGGGGGGRERGRSGQRQHAEGGGDREECSAHLPKVCDGRPGPAGRPQNFLSGVSISTRAVRR